MEEALTALLLANAPLVAAVGGRVHWGALPRHVTGRPYVTLSRVAAPDGYLLAAPGDLVTWILQADVWAESRTSAAAVERALRAAVSGYRGTVSGVRFSGIFITGADDDLDEEATGERLHRVRLDLSVSWAATS